MKKTYMAWIAIAMALIIALQPINTSAANGEPAAKASQAVISKGTTTKVTVTYNKKNVTNKAKFKTSNKNVATVSKKGVVTGKKAGTAYITAAYKGKTAKKVKITVAQISLNWKNMKLSIGKTATLTAKYNKKNVKAAFKSRNPAVASVNKAGVIKAKKAGTATITATYKKTKATCKVTVIKGLIDHASTRTITRKPTCTEEGIAECKCTCGETWTETIPALGHAWDKGMITGNSIMTYTCTRCGETKTVQKKILRNGT